SFTFINIGIWPLNPSPNLSEIIIFITLHLLGSKMTEHTASSITFEYHDLSQNIHELITCVCQALGLDMSKDNKLHTSLITHIKPARHRI
ncbi:hypothetical protein ABUR96_01980, partial [Staphylococcus aureus]